MPGFTTHYLFGVDAYQRIPLDSVRNNLTVNHSAYALGLQGPDLFFYYLPSYLFHRRNLGAIAHSEHTGQFFLHLMESRLLFTGDSRKLAVADAYLTGFLGHYTLDCTVHPFVYAFTGYTPDRPPTNLEYFGQHAYFETEIDKLLLYRKKHRRPSHFYQHSTILLTRQQRKVISQMLTFAYRNTYPELLLHELMIGQAAFCMILGTAFLRDPSGQKKVLARLMERILIGRAFLSPMVPSDRYRFVHDPLNETHRRWVHPWTGTVSHESFRDLYRKAGDLYQTRISHYYQMLHDGFTEDGRLSFAAEYGNRSFQSGEECVSAPVPS